MAMIYHKRSRLRPNPGVAREIAGLDAERDCQRIVYLLAAYEFSWDFNRALELALFYTYGSASISRLLDTTGEFGRNGQKRYDDTRLLITHFMHSGWDGEFGRRALERINKSHGHYRIDQDDFIFTLWTFIEFPLRWAAKWAPRKMTAHEQAAWFNFWLEIGRRMNIRGIPESYEAYTDWIETYKQKAFVPSPASARVAAATVGIIEGWLPDIFRGRTAPAIYALFDDDPLFLSAIGAPPPSPYLRPLLEQVLKASARLRRHVVIGDYPASVDSGINRTYGNAPYKIEELAPERLRKSELRHPQAGQEREPVMPS